MSRQAFGGTLVGVDDEAQGGTSGTVQRVTREEHVRPHAQDGWQDRFIKALSKMANVRAACEVGGVSRTHAYRTRGEDEAFRAAWDEALEESLDRLEQASWTAAVVGEQTIRRTYGKDGKVATETIQNSTSFNDRALLLKAHRPEKYRERYEVRRVDDSTVDREIMALAEELKVAAAGEPVPDEAAKDPALTE